MKTLALVHTSHVLIPVFSDLAKDLLPTTAIFHMVDESLIKNTIRSGHLTSDTKRRVVSLIGLAREGGADAVLLTCSSIGPSVDVARSVYDFPVFRIDEAMAEKAVSLGSRIGVAATLRTTLEPTIELLQRTARSANKHVEIIPALCVGAFEAVLAGKTDEHDSIVRRSLEELARHTPVVVLAQASRARVVSSVDANGAAVLSSPELAMRRVRDAFAESGATV